LQFAYAIASILDPTPFCLGLLILFTKADIHAGLTHVVWFPRIGAGQRDAQARLPSDPCRMLKTNFYEKAPSSILGE
jgi:hypothetical protein